MRDIVSAKFKKPGRIYFGWSTVLTGGFLSFWGHGFYTQGFSAFLKPVAAELGLSRAQASIAASIGRFQGGFEALITGWITDKFGPRWVILAGAFLFGLGLMLMLVINSHWAYYVVWGIIVAIGVNAALTLPMEKAISNWFVKKRGFALSVRHSLTSLATIAVLPLITWLIVVIDWRMTCVIGGIVMWVVGLPLTWFFVRQQRPEYYGMLPDGAETEEELITDSDDMVSRGVEYAAEISEIEFTLRQAMKTPSYWLLILGYAFQGVVSQSIMIHSIPFLTDMGIEPVRAALMMATASAVNIPTRLIVGHFTDRVSNQYLRLIIAGTFVLTGVGIVVFLLNQSVATAWFFIIMFYAGFTSGLPVISAIRARYYGRKAFGSIHGTSMMITAPFGFIAPIYAGWVYDTTGNYTSAFTLFGALLAAAVVVTLFASPPRPPSRITDIKETL